MSGTYEMNEQSDKYAVWFKGAIVSRVNEHLIATRNISDEALEQIKERHLKRLHLFEQIEATDNFPTKLQFIKDWRDNEFALQELWGFERDETFHHFWDIPGCRCNLTVNSRLLGQRDKSFSIDCPYHKPVAAI